MQTNLNNNFHFGLPIDIEKGIDKSTGKQKMLFKGLASNSQVDSQNEMINQGGMDLSEFRVINWNHMKTPDGILGEPIAYEITKKGLEIKGELYNEVPLAQSTYNLMQALKKRGKSLYLSVEGQVLARDPLNKSKITKAKITGCALTAHPINSSTFAELIEKGYTNNDWQYDSETETLMKAMEAGSITGTETTGKTSMTAQPLKAEDVEGAKGKKHDMKTCKIKDCKICIEDGSKKILSKSSAYESIFAYFCNVDVNKATQIYQLAEKISHMEKTPISQETLKKAFDIINLAAQDNKTDKSVDEAVELIKSEEFEGLEKSEVIEALEKAGFDKKVAEEAAEEGESYKHEKKEQDEDKKKGKDHKKEDKKKKKDDDDDKDDEKEEKDEVKKSFDALKLSTEEFQNNSDLKLGAIGVILKSQNDTIDALMKSNEALTETINSIKVATDKIAATPIQKGKIGAQGLERFEKSEEGFSTYNLKNKEQRKYLADKLENLSGFGRNDGKFDESLMKAAQDIEMLHVIGDTRTINYLKDVHKILVVNGE